MQVAVRPPEQQRRSSSAHAGVPRYSWRGGSAATALGPETAARSTRAGITLGTPCTTGTEVLAQVFNAGSRRFSDVRIFEAGRRMCMERNRMSSVARGGHPSSLRGTAETNRSGAESGADGAPNAASLGAVRRGGAAGLASRRRQPTRSWPRRMATGSARRTCAGGWSQRASGGPSVQSRHTCI